MPLPEKLERVPPETVTSARAKFVEASESVNVISAVSLAVRLLSLVVMATVGGRVSTERVSVLLTVLELLAASVNVLLATEMTPLVVLLGVGVKVAV